MATLPQRPRPALPGREIKPFPARSTSYRALSIIDAYSSDISLPEDDKKAPAVLKSIQRLRSKHETINESYSSSFDIDEAYGSGEADLNDDDMGAAINLDDYDPYRSTTPPPRTATRTPKVETKVKVEPVVEVKPALPPKSKNRAEYTPYSTKAASAQSLVTNGSRGLASQSEPSLAMYDDPAIHPALPPKDVPKVANGNLLAASAASAASKSAAQLNLVTTPRSAKVDKALPTVPRKQISSPTAAKKEQKSEKQLPVIPKETTDESRSRKDSMIQSDKGIDRSSATSSPRSKKSPALSEVGLESGGSPKRSFEEEGVIRVPRGINRNGKPASLLLTKSNGSTLASEPEDIANGEVAKPARAVLPPKVLSPVSQLLNDSSTPAIETVETDFPVPSKIVPSHVASSTATATATATQNSNPAQPQAETGADARPVSLDNASLADDEAANSDMNRLRNFVKRKPVGAAATAAAASKENTVPQRVASPTKPRPSLPSNPYPQSHARNVTSTPAVTPTPNQSLEEFPPLESQNSSTTIILAPKPEVGRPNTPPVLRSPTPLSQLEESPSKYGLKKKSELDLRNVDEERQSQNFGQASSGVLRFLASQKALEDSFADDGPKSPIFDANTVIQNEAERMTFYHVSLLDYIKERPHDSNAPRLGTIQLHCHNDHLGKWFTSSNTVHPINCALCDVDGGSRLSCSSCGIRVCQECCDKIKTRAENTEVALLIKGAKEETERRRAESAARRARSNTAFTERTITPSRPGSPNMYPPESETLYGDQFAASSTSSLPAYMRPQRNQGDMRGQQYPPSAWNRMPAPTYGRPPGSRRMSMGSMNGPDVPPTPQIPDQYLSDGNSKNPIPRSSKGSDMEMRGRPGYSPERGFQQGAPRYGSPMRGPPEPRARSKPRAPQNLGFDPMAELRKPVGPYPEMSRGAGARTPGSMQ